MGVLEKAARGVETPKIAEGTVLSGPLSVGDQSDIILPVP